MKVVKAPTDWSQTAGPRVFVSGSSGTGLSVNWRVGLARLLDGTPGTLVTPCREERGPSGEVTKSGMGDWDLEARESCDIIVFYFDETVKSPIALLELGLSAIEEKAVVSCPRGFWCYAAVKLTCDYYQIPMVPDLESLAEWVSIAVERHLNAV